MSLSLSEKPGTMITNALYLLLKLILTKYFYPDSCFYATLHEFFDTRVSHLRTQNFFCF